MNTVLKLLPTEKSCSKCKLIKSANSFDRHSDGGLQPRCKECRHEDYLAKKTHAEDKRKNVVLTDGGRECLDCKEPKLWSEFINDKWGYNGKTAVCRPCRNKSHREKYPEKRRGIKDRPDRLRRLYNLTYEQLVHMLDSQHSLCANRACGKTIHFDPKGTTRERAVIDHNHTTGKVRGLLCSPCNLVLGTMEKKENLIIGLMEYKTKYDQN